MTRRDEIPYEILDKLAHNSANFEGATLNHHAVLPVESIVEMAYTKRISDFHRNV